MRFCLLICLSITHLDAQDGLLGMSLPAEFRAFAPDSPWNTAIPPEAPLDTFSKQMVANLKKKTRVLKADMRQWTIPLFVIDADSCPKRDIPTHSKRLFESVDPDKNNVAEGIPFPEGIWPDPQRDGHLLLVDPKLRRSWDFSRLRKRADGSWEASRIDSWDLDGPGWRKAFRGSGWWTAGARGSGMPLIAGLVRPEQIEAGSIDHALVFGCPIVRKSTYQGGASQVCSPTASRTDGKLESFDSIPMGARLQLDPELDLDSLGLSPASKVIARAMQTHGMFLCDGAGAFKIYLQNLGKDGKSWQRFGDFKDLARVPIERFRVLRCSLRLDAKNR